MEDKQIKKLAKFHCNLVKMINSNIKDGIDIIEMDCHPMHLEESMNLAL